MMHNNSSLIAFSKIPNPTRFQKTVGINDFYFGDPRWRLGFPLGAMQMLGKSDAVLIGFDVPDADDPAELARHSLDFWLTTEDLPLPAKPGHRRRRRRHPPALPADQPRRAHRAAAAVRGPARRDAVPGHECWRTTATSAAGSASPASPTRTARSASAPTRRTSALDLDCKLHELDNVYVADSSFFVSSSAVNPTLTIIANALRVADRIADRLGSSTRAEALVG